MDKKLLQFFFLFFTIISLSQEKRTLITGKVVDSLGIVKNANIINLKTNQGTFSSDTGHFSIYAAIGDALQISSIQYVTKEITISKKSIENKSLNIKLIPNTYVLDEFELKRNHLMGRLGVDINAVPTDKRDSLLRNVMDFSNVDFKQKDFRIDENNRAMPKVVNTVANSYSGLNVGKLLEIISPFKKLKKTPNLDDSFKNITGIQSKLLSELGEDFFFEKLKIPKEKYYHFLEYCNPLGIEKLYTKNKILDIIQILQKESIPYLKLIKEN